MMSGMRGRGSLGLALVLLVILAAPSDVAWAGSVDDTVARRTPPAEAWRAQRFEVTEYFSSADLRRWAAYRQSQRRVGLVSFGLELALYLLLLLTTIGRRMLERCLAWAGRLGGRWPFSTGTLAGLGRAFGRVFGPDWHGALLFAFSLYGLANLIGLPVALYQEHLAVGAGLSVYRPGAWIWDAVKGFAIGGALFGCLVFGLYGLIRRFPRRWWLVLALPAAVVMVAYGYVEPQLPRVYHDVRPLDENSPSERQLGLRLRRLARRSGVTLTKIKIIRASRTSRTLGAYVVGLGAQRELVIYDSLVSQATPAELEAVVAHELGHEQHRNDLRTYGLASVALIGLLWLLAVALRRGSGLVGARDAGDVVTLPLLAFILWLVFTLAGPVIAYRSRVQEREADRHGLVLTGDPDAFIRLQVRLARRNRAEVRPPRWVTSWLRSHPTTYQRIGTARWYRGWLRARGAKNFRGGAEKSPARAY
jgi:Zn-dependent protease with chaperone function